MPVSSFYRVVLNSDVGLFDNLPPGKIMTVNLDVPDAIDVVRTVASVDTDNLRTEDSGVSVTYGITNILVHGQCYEKFSKRPPNGLQVRNEGWGF